MRRPAAASTKALRPPGDTTRREYESQIASGAAKSVSPSATTRPAEPNASPAAAGSSVSSAIGPPIDATASPTKSTGEKRRDALALTGSARVDIDRRTSGGSTRIANRRNAAPVVGARSRTRWRTTKKGADDAQSSTATRPAAGADRRDRR